jgi:hypothetical protein
MKEGQKSQQKENKARKNAQGCREDFSESSLAGLEPCRNSRTTQTGTSPWQRNMTVGGIPTIRTMLQNE